MASVGRGEAASGSELFDQFLSPGYTSLKMRRSSISSNSNAYKSFD
jgi:hypothetical protein